MKALFTFIIWILIWASWMYYVFQNSLQENMETLLTSTMEAVQTNLSEQAEKIDWEIADDDWTATSTWWTTSLSVDKDMINKLIESQKEEVAKILEEQKDKIAAQLEGSIKEYLTNKVSEVFGN